MGLNGPETLPILIMSPSTNFRWSGIPWQIASFTELRSRKNRREKEFVNYLSFSSWKMKKRESRIWKSKKKIKDSRANWFWEVSIVEGRRVGVPLDDGIMYDFVDLVRCDSRSNMGCSEIENFSCKLRIVYMNCLDSFFLKKVFAGKLTRQTTLIFSCSSGLSIRGGWPPRWSSEAGVPETRRLGF